MTDYQPTDLRQPEPDPMRAAIRAAAGSDELNQGQYKLSTWVTELERRLASLEDAANHRLRLDVAAVKRDDESWDLAKGAHARLDELAQRADHYDTSLWQLAGDLEAVRGEVAEHLARPLYGSGAAHAGGEVGDSGATPLPTPRTGALARERRETLREVLDWMWTDDREALPPRWQEVARIFAREFGVSDMLGELPSA